MARYETNIQVGGSSRIIMSDSLKLGGNGAKRKAKKRQVAK